MPEHSLPRFDKQVGLYMGLGAALSALLLLSNVLGGKLFEARLGGLPIIVSVGAIPFVLSFLVSALLIEFYGARAASAANWTAVALSLFTLILFVAVGRIPFAAFTREASWSGMDAASYARVFLSSERLLFASLVAFAAAQTFNIALTRWLKTTGGVKSFALRTALATLGAQILDTLVMELVSWWGVLDASQVLSVIALSLGLKALLSFLVGPVTALVHHGLRIYLALPPSWPTGAVPVPVRARRLR
jgi:queuosine precursor transporter